MVVSYQVTGHWIVLIGSCTLGLGRAYLGRNLETWSWFGRSELWDKHFVKLNIHENQCIRKCKIDKNVCVDLLELLKR